MAQTIQDGERKACSQDFYGFLFQGAAYEGLTCNALEWLASGGGEHIVESDGKVSINNPQARSALTMAQSSGWHYFTKRGNWLPVAAAWLRIGGQALALASGRVFGTQQRRGDNNLYPSGG